MRAGEAAATAGIERALCPYDPRTHPASRLAWLGGYARRRKAMGFDPAAVSDRTDPAEREPGDTDGP